MGEAGGVVAVHDEDTHGGGDGGVGAVGHADLEVVGPDVCLHGRAVELAGGGVGEREPGGAGEEGVGESVVVGVAGAEVHDGHVGRVLGGDGLGERIGDPGGWEVDVFEGADVGRAAEAAGDGAEVVGGDLDDVGVVDGG